MKLLIVSHTPHYLDNGVIKGWGPTLREIDHLATLFDEVVHLAPLHRGPAPQSALPYKSGNVRHAAVPPAGGKRLIDKIAVLWHTLTYLQNILKETRTSDVIHVRCPSNISMLAIVCLAFLKYPQKRWIKYAGNWKPKGREALSYKFQRWWLKINLSRSAVTVNGIWSDSPSHIHVFLNPCLTENEIKVGRRVAEYKTLSPPVQLLFVGRVEREKGIEYALKVVSRLKNEGIFVHLDIIGDGPERMSFERTAKLLGVTNEVKFHGWKSRTELAPFYSRANIMLFPSYSSEGWPKVLSEAMAFGVVPLTSNVSSIPQCLRQFGTGHAFEPDDIDAYFQAITNYLDQPNSWKKESLNGTSVAPFFSYESYLESVRRLLELG